MTPSERTQKPHVQYKFHRGEKKNNSELGDKIPKNITCRSKLNHNTDGPNIKWKITDNPRKSGRHNNQQKTQSKNKTTL
jgi:hypothetical protein